MPARCRYVSDLTVGSIALQDPPATPHSTHMTFSAKRQLAGWAPTAGKEERKADAAAAAPSPRPRLFVVFEDGSGYEVLDQDLFRAYAQRQVSNLTEVWLCM